MLSWTSGAVECCVVAAAGHFVLLRPERPSDPYSTPPTGACSLTYLEGMVPMGWDGEVEAGAVPGELRFRVTTSGRGADRRSAVRIPIFAEVEITSGPMTIEGHLLDVSGGGLRLRNPGRLEAGSLVRIRAELPYGLLLDSEAVVRTSEPGVTSVEFTAMHGASAEEIGKWTVAVLRASLADRG